MYVGDKIVGEFFETVAKELSIYGMGIIKVASNYITSDVVGFSKSLGKNFTLGKITGDNFVKLMIMVNGKSLSSRGAKDTLKVMFEVGGDPEVIAKEKGLIQQSNTEEIKLIAEKILRDNPKVVEEYKSGKESLLQFFIGQGMKETKGSVNPEMLKEIILELLKNQK